MVHQGGAGGADLHQGPHLADGRVVPQHEQHAARTVDLTALVGGALGLPAGAGGVGVHGRGPGVRADMSLGEAAQGREVARARRHRAGRGAGDGRRAVTVAGDADGPCPSRTAYGRAFGVWEVQDRQSFDSGGVRAGAHRFFTRADRSVIHRWAPNVIEIVNDGVRGPGLLSCGGAIFPQRRVGDVRPAWGLRRISPGARQRFERWPAIRPHQDRVAPKPVSWAHTCVQDGHCRWSRLPVVESR